MLRSVIAVCFLLTTLSSFSQRIGSISFEGLNRTKQSYIAQFVECKIGDPIDSAQLELDRQRLTNVEVLSSATYQVLGEGEERDLVFICQELHTVLPIFSFGGIKENFWIQTGVSDVNLGGRGNKLTTYYQYYDRSSLAAHLTFDRIKQSPWGVNVNLVKWATIEPLFFNSQQADYEYTNYTIGATGLYNFNFTDRIEFGGAFFTENYQKLQETPIEGAPDEVDKNKILGKVSMTWNRVNYHFFYLIGWHVQLNAQTVQSLDDDPAFYIMFNDFKKFHRFGKKGNFASRLRLGLSTNEESPFAPFVLDSYLNIRGVGNRVDRGTGAIILNLEHRQTLCEREKFAIQAVAFSDMGSWRNPGGGFDDFTESDNLVLFAGGGFRFIHKKIYNAIFRIDYGINLQDSKVNGFVLGIGQYF